MKNVISAFILACVTFTSFSFAADTPAKPAAAVPAATTAAKATAPAQQESVNINTADLQVLTTLKALARKKQKQSLHGVKQMAVLKWLNNLQK